MQVFRIEFDDDAKFSLNRIWSGGRGMQWIRKKMADDWHYWSEKAIEDEEVKPIKGKVYLFFYFSFMKNMLDSSNCAPMAKAIEDTLTREGILKSDTNDTVLGVFYESVNKPLVMRKKMEYHSVDVVIYTEEDDMYKALNKQSEEFINK